MNKSNRNGAKEQECREQGEQLERQSYRFLSGLLGTLNANIDRRLVETFFTLVLVILMHRQRNQGLVLSELGAISSQPGVRQRGPSGSATCCVQGDGMRHSLKPICG